MTISETEDFYKNDTRAYDLVKNGEFLEWLYLTRREGYKRDFLNVISFQELIDTIADWYEIKYPERELERLEGIKNEEFGDVSSLAKVMTIKQLFFRLELNKLLLLKGVYRAKGGGTRPIYEDGKIVGWKFVIFMHVGAKSKEKEALLDLPYFMIFADSYTGIVEKSCALKSYFDFKRDLTLDELLAIFQVKCANSLDFKELSECVYNHTCDLEVREKLLSFVALKLLYSRKTTPERGLERAQRFINEFNKELGLTLSLQEIMTQYLPSKKKSAKKIVYPTNKGKKKD